MGGGENVNWVERELVWRERESVAEGERTQAETCRRCSLAAASCRRRSWLALVIGGQRGKRKTKGGGEQQSESSARGERGGGENQARCTGVGAKEEEEKSVRGRAERG